MTRALITLRASDAVLSNNPARFTGTNCDAAGPSTPFAPARTVRSVRTASLVEAVLAAFTFFWYLRGAFAYGKKAAKLALAAPLAPLVTVVHATGTVAGIYAPPKRVRVTTKVRGEE